MKIITVSREFGSGGRELGKRIADIIGCAYYDKEVIAAIAEDSNLDEEYIERLMATPRFRAYPITIGRTFSYPYYTQQNEIKLLLSRQRVLKSLADQGDCVIMGQGADYTLREYQPLNLFIYATMESKLRRCKERAPEDENLSDKELKRKILQIDEERAKQYKMLTDSKWGKKENYHLCINTTGMAIKTLAPLIAEYARYWFGVEIHENTINGTV